eukprot:940959-Amphidinium_carterae.1
MRTGRRDSADLEVQPDAATPDPEFGKMDSSAAREGRYPFTVSVRESEANSHTFLEVQSND